MNNEIFYTYIKGTYIRNINTLYKHVRKNIKKN